MRSPRPASRGGCTASSARSSPRSTSTRSASTNFGDPHPFGWKIYPAQNGGDPHGMGRIAPLMQALQLSLVFMMSDVWLPARYYPAVREANRDVPVVAYCPIDSGPVDAEVLAALAGINRFVVYNEFARREVENAVARIRQDDPQFAFPEVDVLPHGVDRATFHPFCGSACGDVDCDGRRQAIRSLCGAAPKWRGAFIVLNATRNQPRKRIDITIRGFAKFAADKPANVKLHLHMGLTDAVWDIPKLARRFGVYDRLIEI